MKNEKNYWVKCDPVKSKRNTMYESEQGKEKFSARRFEKVMESMKAISVSSARYLVSCLDVFEKVDTYHLDNITIKHLTREGFSSNIPFIRITLFGKKTNTLEKKIMDALEK